MVVWVWPPPPPRPTVGTGSRPARRKRRCWDSHAADAPPGGRPQEAHPTWGVGVRGSSSELRVWVAGARCSPHLGTGSGSGKTREGPCEWVTRGRFFGFAQNDMRGCRGYRPVSEYGVTFFRRQDENVVVGVAAPPVPRPAGAHERRTLHWVLGCGSVCWIRVFGCSRAPHLGTGSGSGKTREGPCEWVTRGRFFGFAQNDMRGCRGYRPVSEYGVTFFRRQDENVVVGVAAPPVPRPAGAHERRTLHWVLGCGSVCWIRVFGCSRAPHLDTGSGSGKTREGCGAREKTFA